MENRFDKLEMSSSKFERKVANPRLQSKSQVEDTARVTAQQFERVIQNTRPTEEVRFERVMQKPTPVETPKPKLDISEFPKFENEPIEREFNTSLEEELNFTFSQSSVDPSSLFDDGYELQDQAIIPNENLDGTFIPEENQIEFFVYDIDKNLLFSDYKFEDWNITTNTSTKTLKSTDTIQLYPAKNLYDRGYDMGNLYALYNFINLELNSSNSNPYYLSDISSDRTEIRIKSNFISNEEIEASFNILKTKIDSKDYFDEFYISFGDNEYHIGVNIEIETENNQDSILIKLYDGLPEQYKVKDELYVATKVAETQAFKVEFEEILPASFDDVQYLQGPNTNLDLKDIVNNSTELKSQDDIKNTSSSESRFNLSSILNQKGVKIAPNYSYDTFDEFVKFSSAKKRIENFYYKVQQIESYQSDLATLDSLTTYDTVTADKNTINNNIENIIKNFDGYEYYLYYNDSDSAYPKSGSQYPYPLLNSTSSEVLNWLGSDVEGSTYYGGILLSASLYDNKNQDWLLYTIPEFIRNNSDNDNYVDFANMTGQHFDELWLYTKAVAEKNNTTNALDEGIPLKLAEEGIKSLGFKGVGNNFNNQDGYIGLTGEDNGSYVPPTGSETITNYIAINEGNIENYFVDDYVEDGYSETLGGLGFPYAIDRVSKEIYKRLYHNMAYLVKKKGTISGLRQLINIWGIPSTILRINEFGGKDKDHSDDYDLWFKRYNYAYKPVSNRNVASSSVLFPWMPLERNRIADGELIVPDNLQFRFKTTGYPSSSFAGGFFSQSLAVKKSDGDSTSTDFDFGIGLFYEEPTTGSYLGADSSEYADWGRMRFYISGAAADGGTAISDDIYLPFFNEGWWSVMLQRDQHVSASDNSNATTYTLYAKNKIYNGADGDMIGFEGSASIVSNISTSINEAWNKFGEGTADGIYLGGFVSGSNVGGITLNEQGKIFSGSLQEFRYYSNDIPEATFNDFVMNPRSIEGNSITGPESSFDIVNFRAPLGGELEAIFTSSISTAHTDTFTSVHPAVSGKSEGVITGSFYGQSIVSNFTSTVNSQGISSTNPILYLNNLASGVESFSGIFSPSGNYILCSSTENITADLNFRVNERTPLKYNDYRINIIRDRGGVLTTVFTQDYLATNEIIVSTPLSLEPGDRIQVQLVWLGGVLANIKITPTDPFTLDHTSTGLPSSNYSLIYYDNNTARNFSESNVETFFLDQPAVGIRNRISNKIQVRDSQSYGTVLSSQRSLEQEYEINEDFTENINSLEVAFSPQDDINDDIIDSFGYGVIADALADPRNISQSLDYYPELRETAEDYFKKYSKGNIYDYIRLIKYIDNSLFKAIKNYVPARTSVSTGIVIKQHMLERNRYRQPVIDQDTIVAYTNSGSYSTPLYLRNLEITGGLEIDPIDGGTGGSVEKYNDLGGNVLLQDSSYTFNDTNYKNLISTVITDSQDFEGAFSIDGDYLVNDSNEEIQTSFNLSFDFDAFNSFQLQVESTIQGIIIDETFPAGPFTLNFTSPLLVKPKDRLLFRIARTGFLSTTASDISLSLTSTPVYQSYNNTFDTIAGLQTVVENTQKEFYDGEYDGSEFIATTQSLFYNPYKVPFGETEIDIPEGTFSKTITSLNTSSFQNILPILPPASTTGDLEINGAGPNMVLTNASTTDIILKFKTTYDPGSTARLRITSNLRGIFFDKTLSTDFTTSPFVFKSGEEYKFELNTIFTTVNNFTIQAVDVTYYSIPFDNSDYNALLNNVNDNRENTWLFDVDYSQNATSPINLDIIRSGSADKAQTPDSNYTARRVIYPRYEGSRVSSANYNIYTSASSPIFLNGDTGSWGGDISYGNTAVVDKHPIYMAHFKSSYNNYTLWGTVEYEIDQLIELPFENILGIKDFEPKTLKIDGDNKYLKDVNSALEIGRKTGVAYESLTYDRIDYSTIKNEPTLIQESGIEYIPLVTNQTSQIGISTTSSFEKNNIIYQATYNSSTDTVLSTGSGYLRLSGSSIDGAPGGEGRSVSFLDSTDTFNPDNIILWEGPHLAIYHTFNYCLRNGDIYDPTDPSLPGRPTLGVGEGIDNSDNSNYFRFSPSSSKLSSYLNENEPFLIERGDEVRIYYQYNSSAGIESLTQDFTVTSIDTSNSVSSGSGGYYQWLIQDGTSTPTNNTGGDNISNIYDIINVTPDPSTLAKPIPNGKITNMTIRKRKQQDSKVLLSQTAPSGSNGVQNKSGGGFLIPTDLSEIQKRNALTIINQLKGKNSFRNDDITPPTS